MPDKDKDIKVQDVDMSDNEEENTSLADRVRNARETVKRKETSIRAKRRAKAREKEMSDPGLVEEIAGLASDASELASTAGEPVSGATDSLGDFAGEFEVDSEGLDEPLVESEGGPNNFVDPATSTESDEMSPDDEILDPADADPFAVDEDDDLDGLL